MCHSDLAVARARNFPLQNATGMPIKKMRAMHTKTENWEANAPLIATVEQYAEFFDRRHCLFLSAARAYSVDELLPPFGFRWNDSMAHVEAVLHGAKAKISSREKRRTGMSGRWKDCFIQG
jgi:hypothetical protein